MRHLFGFDVVGKLRRKECRGDKINASFCTEATFCNTHGCSFDAIAETEPKHRIGTLCHNRRYLRKWRLCPVEYIIRGCVHWGQWLCTDFKERKLVVRYILSR